MEKPVRPEQQPEPPARKRRTKFAVGTTPPPMEASKPKETIEEMPQDLLKAEPPEIPPSKDTQEALEAIRAQTEEVAADKQEWEDKKEAAEAAAAAAEERRQIIESRGKTSLEDMHAILAAKKDIDKVPDMSAEAQFEDPHEEFEHQMEKGWPRIAEHHLKDQAAAMKAVESLEKEQAHEERKKKKWWERLRDML